MSNLPNSNKICIVVPIYNEGPAISKVVNKIRKSGYRNIIIVDDGSTDNSYKEAQKTDSVVLRFTINRGKGAAVKTGIDAAKILGADIIITMDGDGQHDPKDIDQMIKLIKKGNDVVLGSRLMNPKGMPFLKILANIAANIMTWLFYGEWVTDCLSGFRAYSQKAFTAIAPKTDRYEFDSEIIREIHRNKLTFIEIPVKVRYTDYSKNKADKVDFITGIKIAIKILISS